MTSTYFDYIKLYEYYRGGGIVLTALDNRIVLNQTVDERLQICYMDVLPSVRYGLFPERP